MLIYSIFKYINSRLEICKPTAIKVEVKRVSVVINIVQLRPSTLAKHLVYNMDIAPPLFYSLGPLERIQNLGISSLMCVDVYFRL